MANLTRFVFLKAIGFSGLRDKTRLIWHALSYTWGDPKDQIQVLVDPPREDSWAGGDKTPSTYLIVTRALIDALDAIRDKHEERLIWIDAICIDQGTYIAARQERELQVRLMYQIYSQAFGVIIWIGHEANDSTYGLQLLDELGALMQVDWKTFDSFTSDQKPSPPVPQWMHGGFNSPAREARAVWNLLGRAWFSRTWIRQEILLADEHQSVLLCGSAWVQLAKFRKAMHFLNAVNPILNENPVNQDERLALVASLCERVYVDEANVMNRARGAECYDARDKIYGALGTLRTLGDARFADSIIVDYAPSNNTEQVYADFVKRHHMRYGTLRLLSEGGLRQSSSMRMSWIPDWRCKFGFLDLSMESATSHFAQAECVFHANNVLEVLGRSVTRIIAVCLLPTGDLLHGRSPPYLQLAQFVSQINDLLNEAVDPLRIAYALASPLMGLRVALPLIEQYRQAFVRYVEYLIQQSQTIASELLRPDDIVGKGTSHEVNHCVSFFRNTQTPIVICDNGYVGAGPQGARVGDVVTAILGSRALMLLRAHGESEHQLVGPCYVHGLNWGEGLLGPLPAGYIVAPQQEPGKVGYKPHYLNTATKETSMFDPRIAWEELEPHPPMLTWMLAALGTDSMRVRPDSHYLERHGIMLERFMLV